MSVRYVSLERVHGLKALRRSSAADASAPGFEGSWLNDTGDLPFRPKTILCGPARLSEALGATPKTNQYGEYLSVRCWCAQPPRYSPDLRALRLLLPEATDEMGDPEQWLFLDTETTGLAGGSGTYAFLVGIAWWEDGGLEIEQFFLREYSEERSLLFALREKMAGRIGQKNAERNVPGLIVPSPFLDVMIHRDGLLRVNNPGRHQVEAYTFDGDLEAVWGKAEAVPTQGFCGCCNPIGLAMLSAGADRDVREGHPAREDLQRGRRV